MNFEKLLEIEAKREFDDVNIIRNSGVKSFLDEWIVTELIGRGAYGNVYKISKPGIASQECALKICKIASPEEAELITQEIEAQRLLSGHPNAVQIEDFALISRVPPRVSYMLIRMELLSPLPKEGLDEQEVLQLGMDICSALEACAAHESKLVHCDIKPENILRTRDGSYKLGDFGTAKMIDRTMGHTVGKGTLLYMAPEVMNIGQGYDCRCDIYSLGWTMLTLLNGGVHPYAQGGSVKPKAKIPSVKGVSEALMKIIRKMCESSVGARYQKASEVKSDLMLIVQKKWRELRSEMRRKERRLAVITSLLVVFIVLFGSVTAYTVKMLSRSSAEEVRVVASVDDFAMTKVDGGYAITAYAGDSEHVIIPDTYMGKPIVGINEYVFADNPDLVSVEIPEGVKYLGVAAFMNCTALEEVKLPSTLEKFESDVFADCISLQSIAIPEGITETGYRTFSGCRALKEISLPESLVSVSNGTFEHCSLLKIDRLPDNVKYVGDSAFQNCISIEKMEIPDGVTMIHSYVFSGCSLLQSVTIPAGITIIEENAFSGCNLLREIELTDGLETIGAGAFADCIYLESIEIPGSVAYIGEEAFKNCFKITSVDIPSGVTAILDHTFDGCSSLSEVNLHDEVIYIGTYAFHNCIAIESMQLPEKMTYIGSEAFSDCISLESIGMPGYMEHLGSRAFAYCSALQSIEIPEGLEAIESDTFSCCNALEEIKIPEGVASIGSNAFEGCGLLKEVVLPDSLVVIEDGAFNNCYTLDSITIPKNVKEIGIGLFKYTEELESIYVDSENPYFAVVDGVLYSKDGKTLVCCPARRATGCFEVPAGVEVISGRAFSSYKELEEIILPDSLVEIGEFAFDGCESLHTVRFGAGLEKIDDYAFGNTALLSVELPDTMKTIGGGAFEGCTSLSKVVLPEGMESLRYWAFRSCSSLEELKIPESMVSIEAQAFDDCDNLTVTAPHEESYYGVDDYEVNWIVE